MGSESVAARDFIGSDRSKRHDFIGSARIETKKKKKNRESVTRIFFTFRARPLHSRTRRSNRRHAASTSRAFVRALGQGHARFFDPTRPEMTVGNLLVRNHNALAKACLGGGFAFGFAYTNNTGTSPIRDVASAAGACRLRSRSRRCFSRTEWWRAFGHRSRVFLRASRLARSARARFRPPPLRKNRRSRPK